MIEGASLIIHSCLEEDGQDVSSVYCTCIICDVEKSALLFGPVTVIPVAHNSKKIVFSNRHIPSNPDQMKNL